MFPKILQKHLVGHYSQIWREKMANISKKNYNSSWSVAILYFHKKIPKEMLQLLNCTSYFLFQLPQRSQLLDKMSMTKGLGVRQFIDSAPLLMTADRCHCIGSIQTNKLINLAPLHYGIRAMRARTLRISDLCLSFSPHPNISDGNFNLVHHFFACKYFR